MRFTLIGILLFTLALSAGESVLTPKDIARLKSVGSAALSKDGDKIAYTLNVPRKLFEEEDGAGWTELHYWDSTRGSRPFITGKVKIGNVQWTPDGTGISFLAKREGDKKPSLYVIPVDGGEAQRILTHETGISDYAWSPNHGKIAFIADEADDKNQKKLEKKGFNQEIYEEDRARSLVWIATFENDEPKKRALDMDGSVSAIAWSPDGKLLAVAKAPTALVDDGIINLKAYVVDAADGKTVMAVKNPGKLSKMSWSPDGKKLGMIAAADRNDPSAGRLYIASLDIGKVDKFFMEDEGDVTHFSWKDANTVVYLWDEGVNTSVRGLKLDSGKAETMEFKGPIFPDMSYASGSKRMALVGSSPSHPKEVYLWEEGMTAAKRVTDSNPWLNDIPLAAQEIVRYKSRDGLELEGILIRPLNEEKGKRYPLIMTIHGGPEAHYQNSWLTSYSLPGQVAAARGFAVFYPNYRASTGRGVAFSKLDHGRPAMEEFDDIVDAIPVLADEMGLVDKTKVGVTGGSYGGYATAWCSTALSEHFAAGVMFVGISNKISKSGTSDIPEELYEVHDRKRLWDDWTLFLKQSPIYHVEKARTPLLIMHGKSDTRVHPSQSMELYRHLKTIGKTPVRLVLYEGEGHGNRRAASRYDYHLRALRWFEHYLKGEGGEKPPKNLDYDFEDESKTESD